MSQPLATLVTLPERAQVSQPAPPFQAPAAFPGESIAQPVKTLSLTDYQKRWLLFFWYPLDFTFVCPTELLALSDRLAEFEALDCAVLGASTDSVYSHRAWMQTPREANGLAGLAFPLLADKTLTIARRYGVLLEEQGHSLRGAFLIDPEGILQFSTLYASNIGRSVDELLRTLAALQAGGLCGSDWKPGQPTLQPGKSS